MSLRPARLAELLADHDDELLAAYVSDEAAVPCRQLHVARGIAGR